ncbi:hypothetical protein AB5I41_31155 [Sphingomonas sp. MMS24-JH45]
MPLLDKGRYKGAHGGRGSGKSQFRDLMGDGGSQAWLSRAVLP